MRKQLHKYVQANISTRDGFHLFRGVHPRLQSRHPADAVTHHENRLADNLGRKVSQLVVAVVKIEGGGGRQGSAHARARGVVLVRQMFYVATQRIITRITDDRVRTTRKIPETSHGRQTYCCVIFPGLFVYT